MTGMKGAKELMGLLAILGSVTLVGALFGLYFTKIVAALRAVPDALWWLKRALGFGQDT